MGTSVEPSAASSSSLNQLMVDTILADYEQPPASVNEKDVLDVIGEV